MNVSLQWVTRQNYKLWKWMLFLIDDVACNVESVKPRYKSSPLSLTVYYRAVFPTLLFKEGPLIYICTVYI